MEIEYIVPKKGIQLFQHHAKNELNTKNRVVAKVRPLPPTRTQACIQIISPLLNHLVKGKARMM